MTIFDLFLTKTLAFEALLMSLVLYEILLISAPLVISPISILLTLNLLNFATSFEIYAALDEYLIGLIISGVSMVTLKFLSVRLAV